MMEKALQNVVLAGILLVGIYLVKSLRQRRRRYANWPQLKRSFLLGHLKVLDKIIASGDRKRHIG